MATVIKSAHYTKSGFDKVSDDEVYRWPAGVIEEGYAPQPGDLLLRDYQERDIKERVESHGLKIAGQVAGAAWRLTSKD